MGYKQNPAYSPPLTTLAITVDPTLPPPTSELRYCGISTRTNHLHPVQLQWLYTFLFTMWWEIAPAVCFVLQPSPWPHIRGLEWAILWFLDVSLICAIFFCLTNQKPQYMFLLLLWFRVCPGVIRFAFLFIYFIIFFVGFIVFWCYLCIICAWFMPLITSMCYITLLPSIFLN